MISWVLEGMLRFPSSYSPPFASTVLAVAFLWVLLKAPCPSRWAWEQISTGAQIPVPEVRFAMCLY